MKVVLDTNVVLSGVFFGGVPGRIVDAWRTGRVTLAVSPSILGEYRRVGAILAERHPLIDFEPFATLLALNADLVQAAEYLEPPVCVDPDDDKFLACARAAKARVVISGDKALLAVSGWNAIQVLRPRVFTDRYP